MTAPRLATSTLRPGATRPAARSATSSSAPLPPSAKARTSRPNERRQTVGHRDDGPEVEDPEAAVGRDAEVARVRVGVQPAGQARSQQREPLVALGDAPALLLGIARDVHQRSAVEPLGDEDPVADVDHVGYGVLRRSRRTRRRRLAALAPRGGSRAPRRRGAAARRPAGRPRDRAPPLRRAGARRPAHAGRRAARPPRTGTAPSPRRRARRATCPGAPGPAMRPRRPPRRSPRGSRASAARARGPAPAAPATTAVAGSTPASRSAPRSRCARDPAGTASRRSRAAARP